MTPEKQYTTTNLPHFGRPRFAGLRSLFNKLFCSCFFRYILYIFTREKYKRLFCSNAFTSHSPLDKLICSFKGNKTVIITENKNHIKVNESNNGNPWIKCHKTNELLCPMWLKLIFVLCFHLFLLSPSWILMNDFVLTFDFSLSWFLGKKKKVRRKIVNCN